jgi:hypothetical protein
MEKAEHSPSEHGLDHDNTTRNSDDLEKRAGSDFEKHDSGDAVDVKEEVKEKDPFIVDFDGENDPLSPLNWTTKKKWTMGGFLSAMTFVTYVYLSSVDWGMLTRIRPLASSMFAPGVPQVLREFGSTSPLLGSMVVSIYILGYACGPLFIAPLSELYGK